MLKYPKEGRLIILSGPAGSGKTTLCERMLKEIPQIKRVVTSTTRKPRVGEINEKDYYFFDEISFKDKIAAGEFYEYASVHGNLYGTLKSEVKEKIELGVDLILNIDVQGAKQIRETAQKDPLLVSEIISVFIKPPNLEILKDRLRCRGTDSDDEMKTRVQVAEAEIKKSGDFDYIIRSGTRGEDFRALKRIYESINS